MSRATHFRILPVLPLALTLVLGPMIVSPARATDYGFSEYTYAYDYCSSVKDPLNLYYQYKLSTALAVSAPADAVKLGAVRSRMR